MTPHDQGFANDHEKEHGVPLGRRLLYDNNGVLVFNEPSDTSISALQDINDPDPDHLGELANYDIAPLTEEEYMNMSIESMAADAEFRSKMDK